MSENTITQSEAYVAEREVGRLMCHVTHSDGTMCEAPIYAKTLGVCTTHYLAAKSGDSVKLDKKARTGQAVECTIDGCENPIYAKRSGLCSKHYVQARKA